jgi:hypothetical protein
MNNLKIIYYFKADDGSVFIELKRLDYKKASDKSKYVSWFRIKNNQSIQLNFIKMNENIRFFNEGQLIINDNNNMFIENKKCISLKYCYINIDNIKLCAENWDRK